MNLDSIKLTTLLLVFVVACASVACSGTRPAVEIERATGFDGSQYRAEDGHPELRLTAMGYLNEEDTGIIHVTADIENRSLIYRHLVGKTTADIEIAITIIGTEDEKRYLDSYTANETIENEIFGPIIVADVTRFEKDIKVPPGRYAVFFSITDKATDSETIREVYVTVPDPADETINLTSIQLFSKNTDGEDPGFEPVTTYNISTRKDSIRFVVQVANNRPGEALVVRSRLIRFDADTSVARSLTHANYSPSSLQYRGIDYRNEEDIEQTQRTLDQPGIILIEYNFERPERGNYRFEVTADNPDNEDEEGLFRARDFSVKGEHFPRIESPRELAEPLIYLMSRREYEELMAIENPDSLKEAVDRFWLENIGSINRARQVIARYYERVEEANRQFTNFKEGWKTDRGMVHILFGPPVRIEEWLNGQRWLGSDQTRDTRYYFVFQRTRMRNAHYPFENFILQRSQGYHNYQYQQIQLWRTGGILNATM